MEMWRVGSRSLPHPGGLKATTRHEPKEKAERALSK